MISCTKQEPQPINIHLNHIKNRYETSTTNKIDNRKLVNVLNQESNVYNGSSPSNDTQFNQRVNTDQLAVSNSDQSSQNLDSSLRNQLVALNSYCSCEKSNCVSGRCHCHLANRACGPLCHGGKSQINCRATFE